MNPEREPTISELTDKPKTENLDEVLTDTAKYIESFRQESNPEYNLTKKNKEDINLVLSQEILETRVKVARKFLEEKGIGLEGKSDDDILGECLREKGAFETLRDNKEINELKFLRDNLEGNIIYSDAKLLILDIINKRIEKKEEKIRELEVQGEIEDGLTSQESELVELFEIKQNLTEKIIGRNLTEGEEINKEEIKEARKRMKERDILFKQLNNFILKGKTEKEIEKIKEELEKFSKEYAGVVGDEESYQDIMKAIEKMTGLKITETTYDKSKKIIGKIREKGGVGITSIFGFFAVLFISSLITLYKWGAKAEKNIK